MPNDTGADAEFMQVAALYRGRADFDLSALVAELVEGESVPFLPILRYKASGLRKREVWERTWDLQRQEDERARQLAAIEESLRQIRSRIERSFFADEQKALDEMELELKKQCIQARKTHAPTVTFEEGWSGTRMVLELESGGITTAQGAAVLQGLMETKKQISHRKHQRDVKVAEKCDRDVEYKAKDREREAIPDDPEIPVPPKYATADFQKSDYWRLRGKLDVPKERWISYPHCPPSATRRSWSAGPDGTTWSKRRPWSPTTTPANEKAGTPNGSYRSWRASRNCCRGFTNGTRRSTRSSARRQGSPTSRCSNRTPTNWA